MTASRRASAPGKIVLSGEYAVLDGAPAVCMAVDRRARAFLAEIEGNTSRVTAAAIGADIGYFRANEGGITWQDEQSRIEVVDAVLRAAEFTPTRAYEIDLDSADFVEPESGRKLGIGSSAAITVALATVIQSLKPGLPVEAAARQAHLELQGGAGSGVDIECSLRGGLIEFRMKTGCVTRLNWPSGLEYRVIWTGVPASTRKQLSKLASHEAGPSRGMLAEAAENMALAWRTGDARLVLEEYAGYIARLRQFGIEHELGIFDGGHEKLWREANAQDLIYKPCGAGGGDIGILLGPNDEVLTAFTSQLSPRYQVLDCRLCDLGNELEAAEAGN